MSFVETLPPKLRYKVPPKLRYKIIAQKRRKNSENTRKARDFSRLIGLIGKNNRNIWFDGPIVEMIYRAFLIPQKLILKLVKTPRLFYGGDVPPGEYNPLIPIGEFVEVILNPLGYFQPDTGNNFVEGAATPFGGQLGPLRFNGSNGEGLMQYLGRHPTHPTWFMFKQGPLISHVPRALVSSIRKSKKVPPNEKRYHYSTMFL